MNKIIITAPFGATFKNLFFDDHFFDEILDAYDQVHIITPISLENAQKMISSENFPSVFIHYIPEKINFLQILFAQFSSFSFNKLIKSDTLEIKLKDGFFLFYQKIIWHGCYILSLFFSWEKLFIFFDYLKFYFSSDKKVRKLISEISPNVVFVTAPSFRFDFSIIKEALELKLPTVGMIHSWDNLSSKGAISSLFDKVIVWNEFQKEEVKNFFNRYKKEQVIAVGIPQLDYFLENKEKLNRKELEVYLNVDSNTKIITYTTGANIPQENIIVEKIVEEFSKFKIKWHLLIRLHPRDNIKRYKKINGNKNVTIETVNGSNFFVNDGRGFQKKDMKHYGNVLKNSDVIINIASTVFLEALILGTPVIGVAFDEKEKTYYKSVRRYYDFNHFKYFSKLKGVHIAYSLNELKEKVIICLKEKQVVPRETSAELAYSMEGKSGKKIADILNEYCHKK